ncbi:MAG: cytidine deaminase [Bacteroidales bacterium]|nr:cytidine deaminase [Bacteroidales bacterium]
MEQKNLIIQYDEYNGNKELSKEDALLLERAVEVTKSAYAPYSNFKVGAALLLSNGEVIAASNQENAAYPSGMCAERVAIFYAHTKYPGESIVSLAVTAVVNQEQCETPTYPCGACRQVMAESQQRGGQPIRIIIGGSKIIQVVNSVDSLLPLAFNNLPK